MSLFWFSNLHPSIYVSTLLAFRPQSQLAVINLWPFVCQLIGFSWKTMCSLVQGAESSAENLNSLALCIFECNWPPKSCNESGENWLTRQLQVSWMAHNLLAALGKWVQVGVALFWPGSKANNGHFVSRLSQWAKRKGYYPHSHICSCNNKLSFDKLFGVNAWGIDGYELVTLGKRKGKWSICMSYMYKHFWKYIYIFIDKMHILIVLKLV